MTTSKYSDILRARGFVHMPPVLIDGVPQIRQPDTPRFCMLSQIGMTHAIDELGETWMKPGLTDLADLEFEDISHLGQALISAFSAVEVDGERLEIPKLQ
ncbi:MAG: hypothetical protein V4682_00695 [Patescibacteria group bacterium]